MKKLVVMTLALLLAAPTFALGQDLMKSYGFKGSKSKNSVLHKKITYRKGTSQRIHYDRKCCDSDIYLTRPDRYTGDRYMSKAARMLYDNEHYNNYVDRNRYLKELRRLELERRRQELSR